MVGGFGQFLFPARGLDVGHIGLQLRVVLVGDLYHGVITGIHGFRDIHFSQRSGHGLPGQTDVGSLTFPERGFGIGKRALGAGQAAFGLGHVGGGSGPEFHALLLGVQDLHVLPHVILGKLQDLAAAEQVHMGNDGVQGERRGVVEDAVGHGIDRRFARADTAARGETVPQRLRERKADAVGPVHVLIGVQRARRRIAQPAGSGTPHGVDARPPPRLGPAELMTDDVKVLLHDLQATVRLQRIFNSLLYGHFSRDRFSRICLSGGLLLGKGRFRRTRKPQGTQKQQHPQMRRFHSLFPFPL